MIRIRNKKALPSFSDSARSFGPTKQHAVRISDPNPSAIIYEQKEWPEGAAPEDFFDFYCFHFIVFQPGSGPARSSILNPNNHAGGELFCQHKCRRRDTLGWP